MYLLERVTGTEERLRDPTFTVSIPRWPQWAGLGQVEGRKQELLPALHLNNWIAYFTTFPRPWSRNWREVEELGVKPVPIWDAGIAGGSSTTVPAALWTLWNLSCGCTALLVMFRLIQRKGRHVVTQYSWWNMVTVNSSYHWTYFGKQEFFWN